MKTVLKIILFIVVVCLIVTSVFGCIYFAKNQKCKPSIDTLEAVETEDDVIDESVEIEEEVNDNIEKEEELKVPVKYFETEIIYESSISGVTKEDETEENKTEEIVDSTEQEAEEVVSEETKNEVILNETVSEDGLISLGEFALTAYCSCVKCCGEWALNRPVDENGNEIIHGASGAVLIPEVSIAVDPEVIPFYTEVIINGKTYIAHDTGGVIKGNKIDMYYADHDTAWNFGKRYAEVFIKAN